MTASKYVNDSDIPDAWLEAACAAQPVQRVLDSAGLPTKNILTCPVRMAFVSVLERKKPMDNGQEGKYSVVLMFPPYSLVDLAILEEEATALARSRFPENFKGARMGGLILPVKDQVSKAHLRGFTPGCACITVTSNYQVPVVDPRMSPLTDPNKIRAGMWAIASINAFAYDVQVKKGVSFGLQSLMVIADDIDISRDANSSANLISAESQFGKVTIIPPMVSPDTMFGQPGKTVDTNAGGLTPGSMNRGFCSQCGAPGTRGQNCAVCGAQV